MNLIEGRQRERDLERQLKLTSAPDDAPEAATQPQHCTVAIFEVCAAAAEAARRGERGFERLLHDFTHALETGLAPGSGDSINRVSGCAELVAVLHGENDKALQPLRRRAAEFAQQHGVAVLCAAGHSHTPDELLERIYLRADEELTRIKNTAAAA
jgi:hypothetical protein